MPGVGALGVVACGVAVAGVAVADAVSAAVRPCVVATANTCPVAAS